ncbi:hypothetical protein ABG775_18660 [Peribacillus simplex]|uniref:hypothetical protein n=1 Tax=Peribacillus simplex TaxID=1478 RepID=UPI003393BEE8
MDEISQLRKLLTVEHLANYLNVSERTADEYIGSPNFPLIRLKRAKRVLTGYNQSKNNTSRSRLEIVC